jgi:hypothetical protein
VAAPQGEVVEPSEEEVELRQSVWVAQRFLQGLAEPEPPPLALVESEPQAGEEAEAEEVVVVAE